MKLAPGLVVTGLVLAVIGGIVWRVQWTKADSLAHVADFTDALSGGSGQTDMSLYTPGAVAGIVILGVGALLVLVGLIGVVIRGTVKSSNPAQQTTGPASQ